MSAQRIRNFLISLPKPASVRVFVDNDPQEIKLGGRSYQKLAETIDAMDGEQVQCLDAEGKVLRAMRLDDAEAQRATSPAMPAVLANDPQAALLSLFANELARAYQYATEIAFTKMVECFDRVNDRSAGIEQRLERAEALARRLRDDQVEDAFERAQEIAEAAGQTDNDSFVNTLANAFVSGQMNSRASRKTNGKANGAGKVNGAPAKGGTS